MRWNLTSWISSRIDLPVAFLNRIVASHLEHFMISMMSPMLIFMVQA